MIRRAARARRHRRCVRGRTEGADEFPDDVLKRARGARRTKDTIVKLVSRKNILSLLAGAALAAPLASFASPADAATVPSTCTRYVAPGAPAGDGTSAANPMSLPALVGYINSGPRPGLVACLSGGSYGTSTTELTLTKGGSAGSPVTIVRNPTATTDASVAGRIVIARGAVPVARLVAEPVTHGRCFGVLGVAGALPDEVFFAPLPEDELAAWEE